MSICINMIEYIFKSTCTVLYSSNTCTLYLRTSISTMYFIFKNKYKYYS